MFGEPRGEATLFVDRLQHHIRRPLFVL